MGHLTLCDIYDCFGTSVVVYSLATAVYTPQIYFCFSKLQLTHAVPPLPASLIYPHNRDLPDSLTVPTSFVQLFNVSSADGSPDSPLQYVVQVLNTQRDAFSYNRGRGIFDSIRISIVTEDPQLFAESPCQVSPYKRRIIYDSIDQLLGWDVIEPSNSRMGYPVVLVRQHVE